jgi:cell volume regulation protein A
MDPAGSAELAKHVLLAFGVILLTGTLSGLLAQKLGIPDVVVFLLAGTALGPAAAGLVQIRTDSALNQLILILARATSCSTAALRCG